MLITEVNSGKPNNPLIGIANLLASVDKKISKLYNQNNPHREKVYE